MRTHAAGYALLAALLLTSLSAGAGSSPADARQTEGAAEPRELAPGVPAVGQLGAAETHLFKLHLSAGQHVRVAVDKGDHRLSVAFVSADGQTLAEHLGERYGPLRFAYVAADAGVAYLRLRSLEEEAGTRFYTLTVDGVSRASARDVEAAEASGAYAEAEALRARWDHASLRAAADRYAAALTHAARAGDDDLRVLSLRGIGDCHFILSEYREALAAYEQALALSRGRSDGAGEVAALNDSGYARAYLGMNTEALRQSELVLSLLAARPEERSAEWRRQQARALNTAGEVYYSLSELRKALNYFERARAAWAEVGDRAGEALAHLNLGYTHTDLGDLKSASEQYDRALARWQAVGDLRGTALTLTAMGGLQSFLGEKQLALDYHGRALRAFQSLGNYQGEAATWNGIAQVYEDLGQSRVALNGYERALRLYEQVGNRDFAALTTFYVGRSREALGEPDAALDYFLRSARLSRAVGNRQFEAHALRGAGTVYESHGQNSLSLKYYAAALKLYMRVGDRRWQARTLNRVGHVHDAAGDKLKALGCFSRALLLSRAVEDRREEVSTLYNLARAERDLGRLEEALDHITPAVGLADSLRLKVAGEELRNSYFASVHQLYELHIDLLMQAHRRRPDAGFAAAALQASERGRARSLLERLESQRAEAGPAPDLLERERALWQQLDFKLESQTRLLNRQHTEAEAEAGAHEIRELTAAYQDVLDRIQRQSPVYATLTQPRLLRAEAIRAEARDDSVLLEYSLGEQRSYVWAVTLGTIEAYELPPRATIEALAEEVYELLTAQQPLGNESAGEYRRRVESSEARYPQRAAELSRMLLGQVASRIEGKRLLIACDGALHRIPFDALPEPGAAATGETTVAGYVPLVLKHEVVTIPSASVLSALRGAKLAGASPQRLIAVLADPVFDRADSRVDAADDTPGAESGARETGDAGGEAPLPRLVSSFREAEAIADLTSARERSISTGFDAELGRVTGGQLAEFRIIHFATHALFSDERPELSGLYFSRVDEQGRRREGFLKVNDIYGLHLNADLVVLSACRTGLGRHVNGEGLLGITRGFMYAGSRGVVASLWKVNDEATAELMKQFYGAMLRDGLAPSAALRAAKEAVLKQERWRSPYFWAAFTMQGECDRALATVERPRDFAALLPAALSLPALALAALITLWAARRVFRRV